MSVLDNYVATKKQMVAVPVDATSILYQNKIFFNVGNAYNLREKIITSMQVFNTTEFFRFPAIPFDVVNVSNPDFATYMTLIGKDGKVIINLMPLCLLYNYDVDDTPHKGKFLRQFLMIVDWQKSYLLLVWNQGPVNPNVIIPIMVGYADNVNQLPEHVRNNIV